MTHYEANRVRRQMQPFLNLMIIVASVMMLASCGTGSTSQNDQKNIKTTVPSISVFDPLPKIDVVRPSDATKIVSSKGGMSFIQGEILATQNSSKSETDTRNFIEKQGWIVVGYLVDSKTYQIDTKISKLNDLEVAIKRAKDSGFFELVMKSYAQSRMSVLSNPDTSFSEDSKHWNINAIKNISAWDAIYSQETKPVKIGVLDTNFVEHSDISFSTLEKAGYKEDTIHGMHVSGIIAAKGNNGIGIAGVSWSNKGVDLIPYSVAALSIPELVEAIKYYRNKGVRVVNLSWGTSECPIEDKLFSFNDGCTEENLNEALIEYTQLFKTQIQSLIKSSDGLDIIFVQSSGNAGQIQKNRSSEYIDSAISGYFSAVTADRFIDKSDKDWIYWLKSHAVIVGSVKQADNGDLYQISSFTSLPVGQDRHLGNFILAPGEKIWSLDNIGSFQFDSGTSMAAPHVTGVLALIFQSNNRLSSGEAIQLLVNNATNLITEKGAYNFVNAEQAVRAALNYGKPTDITPKTATVGKAQEFTLTGINLPTTDHFDIVANGCGNITFGVTTSTRHTFTCTPTGGDFSVAVSSPPPNMVQIGTYNVSVSSTPLTISLNDTFDGNALDSAKWVPTAGSGSIVVENGEVTLGAGSSASTQGKKIFSGSKIVIQARFAGKKADGRDTHIDLVDTQSGNLVLIGDTSYDNRGLYIYGNGGFGLIGANHGAVQTNGISTTQYKYVRITIDGSNILVERGDSPDQIADQMQGTLGESIAEKDFYLRIGTGSNDGIYSPATFDWISVSNQ